MKQFLIFSGFFLFLSIIVMNAQESSTQIEKRIYTTKSVGQNQSPIIDGKLEDAVWDIVDWGNDYIDRYH